MGAEEAALLIAGGLIAGFVNTLAGGGSLLTIPLLVLLGLPGTLANGTNRVGILVQNLAAAWRFRVAGVAGLRSALPVLLPVATGSAIGAVAVSRIADATFERLFGALMIALLIPTLRGARRSDPAEAPARRWHPAISALVFFAIGVYGGSFQAGVGIVLVFALAHAGHDLVHANAIKVIVIATLAMVAVPIFAIDGRIAWAPAGLLAAGFALGGVLGAHAAVRGGERWIRPVLAASVIALAGRMLGFF